MIPNLDFIKTALNGITAFVEKAVKSVEAKIVTPDFEAKEDEAGYIKNKPEIVAKAGTGDGSVVLGTRRVSASGDCAFAHGRDGAHGVIVEASGDSSHAEGIETRALGIAAHAEGVETEARGHYSHAEGQGSQAISECSHAEGYATHANGSGSHTEGHQTITTGYCSHAEGASSCAEGDYSHAEGGFTRAIGMYSHAEGDHTTAQGKFQHVQGKFNVVDTEDKYAHIVGNGEPSADGSGYSNAYTLDWEGNAWYAGSIEGTALILKSSTEGSTKRFKITVDDSGALTAAEITE